MEIDRLYNNLLDWEWEVERIRPISTDVGCIRRGVLALDETKMKISAQGASVRIVDGSIKSVRLIVYFFYIRVNYCNSNFQCEAAWRHDDELMLLRYHGDSLIEKQRSLNDSTYIKLNSYKTAARVIDEIQHGLKEVSQWLLTAQETFNGRPLLIRGILDAWRAMKEKLVKSEELRVKFDYVFPELVSQQLRDAVMDVRRDWQNVKLLKIAHQAPQTKVHAI